MVISPDGAPSNTEERDDDDDGPSDADADDYVQAATGSRTHYDCIR